MNRPHVEVKRESFTLREIEVLGMIARGLTNQEISQELHVSTETVKWYAKQLYPKLGVSNRTQAALKADEVGLLEFGKASSRSEDKTRKLGNLPTQLTSYIGRQNDVANIQELLLENRLITLTGAGGIGKTRLALQVASQVHENYRDGVWLVELAQISDPAQVVTAVAKILAISQRKDTALDRVLKNYLRNKYLLLLIDNFEHLLDAAPFVGELLADAADVSILSTSREKLHVYGEIEYPVAPLGLPDARRNEKIEKIRGYEAISLFSERAQATIHGYKIDDDQIHEVAKICRLLDGLPLAIELAAPLVKLLTPSMIAERLETNLEALPDGPRDMPARQRTLRATLEWSYGLLSENEKRLFTNMAVFSGGGTFEAIEAIGGTQKNRSVLNTLASLVNRNLLVSKEGRDGEIYFRMLETTRQLIKERLSANDNADIVFEQHAGFYLNIAERAMEEFNGPKNKYWFIRLQIEQENLRTAFDWFKKNDLTKSLRLVTALRNYWQNYGYSKEGLRWVETGLNQAQKVPDSVRAGALLAAGDYCLDLNQEEKAGKFLREALEISETLGDKPKIARCNALMSIATIKAIAEIPKGSAKVRKSLEIFMSQGDKSSMADINNVLGELSRMGEDFEAAEDYYKKSLELTKETGQQLREGILYANLGMLAYQRCQYQVAEKLTKQGLRIFLDMDAYYGIYYDIGGVAGAALGMGNPVRAAKLLGASSAGLDSLEVFHQQTDQIVIQHILDGTKRALGEQAFKAAWEDGRRMTVQEAFEYALSESE